MSKILEFAFQELGVKEIEGSEHENRIIEYARQSGMDFINDDETPWCSVFVNWVCVQLGLARSGKANARSWVNVGMTVEDPLPGDVVVFWRESVHSWKGHVAFFLGYSHDLTKVYCLGGNQNNQVSVAAYDAAKVLRFNRLESKVEAELPEPVLKKGAKGDEVVKLQVMLNQFGYNCGDPDGDFGPKTMNAFKKFQADNRLNVDGVYGKKSKNFMESLMQQ